MKYTMTVTIADPETPVGMSSDLLCKIDCTFAHDPDQYGNGYMVRLKMRGDSFRNVYDLRYDTSFNPSKKAEWLEKWAHGYWSGKDGAYIVKDLKIEKAE